MSQNETQKALERNNLRGLLASQPLASGGRVTAVNPDGSGTFVDRDGTPQDVRPSPAVPQLREGMTIQTVLDRNQLVNGVHIATGGAQVAGTVTAVAIPPAPLVRSALLELMRDDAGNPLYPYQARARITLEQVADALNPTRYIAAIITTADYPLHPDPDQSWRYEQSSHRQARRATLDQTLSIAATTLTTVEDLSGWPPGDDIVVDSGGTQEWLHYTARAGRTLSGLTRGLHGTTAQTHIAGGMVCSQPRAVFALAAALGTSGGTLTLVDATGIPSVGNLVISNPNEIISYLFVSGNTLAITGRGLQGSGISSHASGSTVQQQQPTVEIRIDNLIVNTSYQVVAQYEIQRPDGTLRRSAWTLAQTLSLVVDTVAPPKPATPSGTQRVNRSMIDVAVAAYSPVVADLASMEWEATIAGVTLPRFTSGSQFVATFDPGYYPAGTTGTIRVRGIDNATPANVGIWSDTAAIQFDTTAPPQPTVTATEQVDGSVLVVAVVSPAPPDLRASVDYQVQVDGNFNPYSKQPFSVILPKFGEPAIGGYYRYRAQSYDQQGNTLGYGAWADVARSMIAPAAPTIVSASYVRGGVRVVMAALPFGATMFKALLYNNSTGTDPNISPTGSSSTLDIIIPFTDFYAGPGVITRSVRVVAVGRNGVASALSAYMVVTVDATVPAVPTPNLLQVDGAVVLVGCTTVVGARGYIFRIYASTSLAGTYSLLAGMPMPEVGSPSLSYRLPKAGITLARWYKVTAQAISYSEVLSAESVLYPTSSPPMLDYPQEQADTLNGGKKLAGDAMADGSVADLQISGVAGSKVAVASLPPVPTANSVANTVAGGNSVVVALGSANTGTIPGPRIDSTTLGNVPSATIAATASTANAVAAGSIVTGSFAGGAVAPTAGVANDLANSSTVAAKIRATLLAQVVAVPTSDAANNLSTAGFVAVNAAGQLLTGAAAGSFTSPRLANSTNAGNDAAAAVKTAALAGGTAGDDLATAANSGTTAQQNYAGRPFSEVENPDFRWYSGSVPKGWTVSGATNCTYGLISGGTAGFRINFSGAGGLTLTSSKIGNNSINADLYNVSLLKYNITPLADVWVDTYNNANTLLNSYKIIVGTNGYGYQEASGSLFGGGSSWAYFRVRLAVTSTIADFADFYYLRINRLLTAAALDPAGSYTFATAKVGTRDVGSGLDVAMYRYPISGATLVLPLTDPAGSGVTDESGLATSRGGGYNGGYTLSTPAGVLLNGSTGFINVPNSTNWDLATGDWTVAISFKATSLGAKRRLIGHSNPTGNGGWSLFINGSNQLELDKMSVIPLLTDVSTTFVTGNWYRVMSIKLGTNYRFYVGGNYTSIATATTANVPATTTGNLELGAIQDAGAARAEFFAGYLKGAIIAPFAYSIRQIVMDGAWAALNY